MNFAWTACKIAWRETRASAGKFLFVIFAVAVAVGSLTGVRGFSQAVAGMLLREARTLLAGDISLRLTSPITQQQTEELESLRRRGIRETRVTETLSMVSRGGAGALPTPASVKAVEPANWPMYGEVKTSPAARLSSLLDRNTALIGDDLRLRLKVNTGDNLRVGGANFRVGGIVLAEPDRLASGPVTAPRVLLSQDGLTRTELIRLGSRAPQRLLFLVPHALNVAVILAEIKRAFPDEHVTDYRETNQNITRALDFCTSFLSLVSLIALIVGGVGVATAMHSHLRQKMDSIAIIKSIGGRSQQILLIYLIQTLMLGLAGGFAGLAIGAAVQHAFPPLLERYFLVKVDVPWVPAAAPQGLLVALATTLLFTLPPLLSIRRIRPSLILRRDMLEARPNWRVRISGSKLAIASGGLIFLGMFGIAMWLIGGDRKEAARVAGYFVAGLVVSILALGAVAWLLLRGLRWFVSKAQGRLPTTLRHGIANLYRPGSHAVSVLTALGLGVMFTLTVYLVQHAMISEISENALPGMPNVFMIDITDDQRAALVAALRAQPAVEGSPELVGTVSGNLLAINSVPFKEYLANHHKRGMFPRRLLTALERKPAGTTVLQGAWWPDARPAASQVSASEWIANYLELKPGAKLEWSVFGRKVETVLVSVHRMDPHRLSGRLDFVMSPGTLETLPMLYYGAVRVKPLQVAEVQRLLYDRFPMVTVINMADVLDRVQEVVTQISLVIRFISLFAILAGVAILASSVAGTKYRRIAEVVIFKTLGATHACIAQIFSAEFLILGTVAGLMGSLLAVGFSAVIMEKIVKVQYHFTILPNLVAVVATALIAVGAGWLASYRILSQKPLEVLRGE